MNSEKIYSHALKDYGLKEAPGHRSNPRIALAIKTAASWLNRDDSVTPWCFPSAYEVLTDRGFVAFCDLRKDTRVCQVDQNLDVSYSVPLKIIDKQYDGAAFRIKSASYDMICDAGHEWVVESGSGQIKKIPLSKAGWRISIPLPLFPNKSSGWQDWELHLIAAFISDGYYKWSNKKRVGAKPWRIQIKVSKDRKKRLLMGLSPVQIYEAVSTYGVRTKIPLTTFQFEIPSFFERVFMEGKTLSREFINGLGRDEAKKFLEYYVQYDGNINRSGAKIYTSCPQRRDDLAEIILKSGAYPLLTTRKPSELSQKESFLIRYGYSKKCRSFDRNKIAKTSYRGRMMCVSMPAGAIIVRSPGSNPILTGNCGCIRGLWGLETGTGVPKDHFRAKEWLNWGKPVKLADAVQGDTVVFRRSGGGHVALFSSHGPTGYISVMGGNQSNAVNIQSYPERDIIGIRRG